MQHRAMGKNSFWLVAVLLVAGLPGLPVVQGADRSPNVIVIFCDDLGYGDLGCYGHPTIRTPNLDRMAREGQKWTNFYAAASVCTPSRAGLLTGRLPVRSGMCSDKRRVLFPDSKGGLPENERTIAELLKGQGYATACVGKWHLGHLPKYLPTNHGFDSYFGIPYSNDMDRLKSAPPYREANFKPEIAYFNVPLLEDDKVLERPADQTTITRRYTERSLEFIKANSNKPFFLYLAHSMPHVPLFRSKSFVGRSLRGRYGDVIEEIDWSVGQILDTLVQERLAEHTLVVFTSDNGPWLIFDHHGGSAGLLRDGKGSTWEGGMREPALFWWPGRIKAGETVADIGSTLDLLPTIGRLSGAAIPPDLVLDGYDLGPRLLGKGPGGRDRMFYYRGTKLFAVRKGPYKAHFITKPAYGRGQATTHDPPTLYHLGHDPSERFDMSESHPRVAEELKRLANEHRAAVSRGIDQLAR